MKIRNLLLIAAAVALAATGGQAGKDAVTQYQYWVCRKGDHSGAEIVFARMGNVFRGEYVDPGFQDMTSIPIMGTIDDKGNVNGISAVILSGGKGKIKGELSGRISGGKFQATWQPAPDAVSMFRKMDMELKKLSPEMEKEIGKHPQAFYNVLFPGRTLIVNGSNKKLSRVAPFLSETPASKATYGCKAGEWETRYIYISPGKKKGDVDFKLYIEWDNGKSAMKTDIKGTAQLNGNTFRYNEKGYEFEAAIYKDFVTIKTIAGSIKLKADGVYPASLEEYFYD